MFPFNPYKLHFFRPWFFHWNGLFPLLIIGVGVYYIYHVLSKEKETDDHASATNAVHRRFYRSKSDRMIGGVCGGIANYFEIDSVLVRLFWVFVTLFSGFLLGVIAYIVILVVIPEADVEAESAEVHPKK
ncbi:PspC domain-containing protein [candidate division KSB1 bacterium]|nr:PspC domain-containing protein [candidate division KSB1 bacterium]